MRQNKRNLITSMKRKPSDPTRSPLQLLNQIHDHIVASEMLHNPYSRRGQIAELFSLLLSSTSYSSPQLARIISVAPQTVNRWKTGKTQPRLGQIKKLQEAIMGANGPRDTPSTSPDPTRLGTSILGVRSVEEMLVLEAGAQDVWIVKNGVLREAVPGFVGDMVLRGLKRGTNFHYVFAADSAAEMSFQTHFSEWIQRETFTGRLSGHSVRDTHTAYKLHLSLAPGAWVAIRYSSVQAEQLRRQFDVFMALPVRQYIDGSRTIIENEDGQAHWFELPSQHAWHLLQTFKQCTEGKPGLIEGGDAQVQLLRLRSAAFAADHAG